MDGLSRAVQHDTREGGQASVEVLGLLPVLVGVGLCVLQLLAAGMARELAAHAAQAGAVAMLQDRPPVTAARAALPRWSRTRAQIRVRGRRVRVRLRPRSPIRPIADLLTATAEADAGPGGGGGR